MHDLHPLRFVPILRRYVWGGRRLESSLGKPLPPGDDWAESWEIADLDEDQTCAAAGPLAGEPLHALVEHRGAELLGRHHPQRRFPLLLKLLDAEKNLSVQVHPEPRASGKSEAWFVLEARPGSLIYAGLKPGVDRPALESAVREGTCEKCLHAFHPAPGDCVFIPPGVVHALGAGLLVAEIQQPSNVTFRLFDWNRLGADGRPRPLHIQEALDAVDYGRGPVDPRTPQPTDRPGVERLVECNGFIWERLRFDSIETLGGDDRCRVICVVQGATQIAGDPAGTPLRRGDSVLLPARLGSVRLTPLEPTELLAAFPP